MKCIEWRDLRYDTDNVQDDIQRELYKEVEMIRGQQERMKDTLKRANESVATELSFLSFAFVTKSPFFLPLEKKS